MVALFEDSEDAKTAGKIHVFSNFRGSRFQTFPGSVPLDPLANLHLRTGPSSSCKEFYLVIKCFVFRQSAYISLQETLPRRPLIHVPPTILMLPTSLFAAKLLRLYIHTCTCTCTDCKQIYGSVLNLPYSVERK